MIEKMLDTLFYMIFESDKKKAKRGKKRTRAKKSDIDDFFKSPQKRGAEYEAYVANIYRERGFEVWERGKELGLKDGGIDLVVTKEDEIILIQCKNWKESSSWKIRQKDIKAFRSDIRDFLKTNPQYIREKMKGRYIISGKILHKGAYIYLKENREILDFEIIRM